MDKNLENSTQNRQDGPHKEGGSNNIASTGQTNPNNNTRGMSEMMNEGDASGDRQNRNTTENEGSNSSDQELGGRH